MKVKYYLRGLGIGILVSVLMMSIASGRKTTMTDEEVKARAKELGMVESTVLSNMGNKDNEPEQDKGQTSGTESQTDINPEATVDEPIGETQDSNVEQSKDNEDTTKTEETLEEKEPVGNESDDAKKETDSDHLREPDDEVTGSSEPDQEKSYVTITVSSGESSEAVSRKLAEAGLVDSAKAYDNYLCENGYDKKIRVGTYSVLEGSSYEEVAVLLTTKKR